MELKDIVNNLKLKVLSAQDRLGAQVKGAYTSDLLSDVIANCRAGYVWITLQIHQNIIAVAKLKDLAGIIIINNREPDKETIKKAGEEQIPLLIAEESAFSVSGQLYQMLNRKK